MIAQKDNKIFFWKKLVFVKKHMIFLKSVFPI